MSSSSRTRVYYWATPTLSLLFGLAFLVAFLLGGHPVAGAIALVLMLVLAAASLVLGRYSETMRGLMDRRDERIVSLDQRAVNGAAIEEVARGRSGAPFSWLAAVFGLTYLATLVVLRLRA